MTLVITILGLGLAWLVRAGAEVGADPMGDVQASLPDDVWAAFDAAAGAPPTTQD